MWKSKPAKIKVIDTLDMNVNPPEYAPTWVQGIESRLAALEGDNSLETTISEIQSKVGNIENIVLNDNERINTLESVSENNSVKIDEAEEEIEKHNNRLETLENAVGIDYSKIYVGVEGKTPNFTTIT